MSTALSAARERLPRPPILTALALVAGYAAVAALVLWQASQHVSPTIFTDEVELTQISRAIADTGHPARRGIEYGFSTLVPWFTAPFWWIDSVPSAYGWIKAFQALVMTAAIFPAYGIARFLVSRPWAVGAAIASVATPALSYAPMLVEEPFAYPIATAALLAAMHAVARPAPRTIGVAVVAAVIAAATRSQLTVVILGGLVLSLGIAAWRSDRLRARRARWTTGDRVGAVVLAGLLAVGLSAVAGSRSQEWFVTTTYYKDRMWDHGAWAAGAWAVGIGVAPAIALVAVLFRPRARYGAPRVRAWVVVTAATLLTVLWYAALKGAYLSTTFATLVIERNVLYLTPLAMAAFACLLAHRDVRLPGLAAAAALVVYAVSAVPIRLDYPYYEAHGLSILAMANRPWAWPAERIDTAVLLVGLGAAAWLLAVVLAPRRRRLLAVLVVPLVAAVATWNVTNEVYAARGESAASKRLLDGYGEPANWVDLTSGGRTVTILGQSMSANALPVYLTEFFNRSIVHVWSIDGSAPGPGPTLTPDLAEPDGRLAAPTDSSLALAWGGVQLRGSQITQKGRPPMTRLEDGVLQLTSSRSGIDPQDGWTGPTAAFNQFATPGRPQVALLTLSRQAFCVQGVPIPSEVTVRIGPIVVGDDRQAALGPGAEAQSLRVTPCSTVPLRLTTPAGPWRIEIASQTFVPRKVDPRLGDARELGVVATLAIEG